MIKNNSHENTTNNDIAVIMKILLKLLINTSYSIFFLNLNGMGFFQVYFFVNVYFTITRTKGPCSAIGTLFLFQTNVSM